MALTYSNLGLRNFESEQFSDVYYAMAENISKPIVTTSNCCYFCGSGIDKSDKTCTHCGAPNENYQSTLLEKKETFGEAIGQIESMESCDWTNTGKVEVRGGINSPLLYTYIHGQSA